ncbi:MAG: immunoglobulin-like domain-containing protein [Cellulosilyticaceae bacterium]
MSIKKFTQKLYATGLAVTIATTTVVPTMAQTQQTSKVVISEWAKKDVQEFMKDQFKTINNYKNTMTREQFSDTITRLFKKLGITSESQVNFSDTDNANIQLLASLGILKGVGENKFSPFKTITREEMACILVRAYAKLGFELTPVEGKNFDKDVKDADSVSEWAKQSLKSIYNAGLMQTTSEGAINPKGIVTIEQGVVFVSRIDKDIEAKVKASKPEPTPTLTPKPAEKPKSTTGGGGGGTSTPPLVNDDKKVVDTVKTWLTFEQIKGSNTVMQEIQSDLVLPRTQDGVTIDWYSSDANIISPKGGVIRPLADTEVTLTAELTKGAVKDTVKIKVVVRAQQVVGMTDQESVDYVKAKLDFTLFGGKNESIDKVTQDLAEVMDIDDKKVSITWTSTIPDILNNNLVLVKRPETDTKIVIIAKIQKGTVTAYKQFDTTVLAKEVVQKTDQQLVDEAVQQLTWEKFGEANPDADNVTTDLGKLGSIGKDTEKVMVSWRSDNEEVINTELVVTRQPVDSVVNLVATFTKGDAIATKVIKVVVKARPLTDGEAIEKTKDWLFTQIDKGDLVDTLPTTCAEYGTTISYEPLNGATLVSTEGVVTRGPDDITFPMNVKIVKGLDELIVKDNFTISSKTNEDLLSEVITYLESFNGSGITCNTIFQASIPEKHATLQWKSTDTTILDDTGKFTAPAVDTILNVEVTITIRGKVVAEPQLVHFTIKAKVPAPVLDVNNS